MDILLITITYPPETRAISLMMREMADQLKENGHHVTVATGQPKDHLCAASEKRPYGEVVVEEGVRVLRVRTPDTLKVNYYRRGLSELMVPRLFYRKIRQYIRGNIDIVIVYTPPLPLATLGIKVKKLFRAEYVLNVQDIVPQNAIDLGVMNNWFVRHYFELLEKRAYSEADRITAHSENNVNVLIERRNVPKKKISSLWNWIDLTPYEGVEKSGRYRRKYGVEDKFVFLFAGVIGPAQDLQFVVSLAAELRGVEDISFLIVGEGAEKDRLQNLVDGLRLKNVLFKGLVSKEDYPLLVKDADVGLACLSRKLTTPVYPGKILSFMAASIPVVAFLNDESDGHHIIGEAGCGYSTSSDDFKKGAELVMRIYAEKEKCAEFGRNGLKYAKANFSKAACIGKMERLIVSLHGGGS